MTKRKKIYAGLFVAFVVLMVIGSLRGIEQREHWVNELNANRQTDAFSADGHTLVISRPYCDDGMARDLTPIAKSQGFSAVSFTMAFADGAELAVDPWLESGEAFAADGPKNFSTAGHAWILRTASGAVSHDDLGQPIAGMIFFHLALKAETGDDCDADLEAVRL